MSEHELRFEGIVRASRPRPGDYGKPFLGAVVECSDGTEWVIDYSQGSPFHAFDGRRVVVSGSPCPPPIQHLIERVDSSGAKRLGHFSVSTMRLVEVTPDAELIEVGAPRHLSGQFGRDTSDSGQSTLTFDTEKGDTFPVANDPAEVAVGCIVKVQAYPVEPSPSARNSPKQYLWILYPCGCADCVKEWHRRRFP